MRHCESRPLLPYRWELVLWLWFAFFLNQGDRQIFSVVLPQLKAELNLDDVQAGLVATLFSAALAIAVPVAGILGDRWDRKKVIVGSLLGWSLTTLCTGFVTGLPYLILVRSLATGAGEALYAPAAYALMAQQHVETRARAMAIHQTALYVGVVASGFLAGWIADRYGWRPAFWSFGVVGIALGVICLFRLQPALPAARSTPIPLWTVFHTLVSTPTVVLLSLAFGCMVFVNVGYLTWMPTYLHERFGLSLANAGFSSMFSHHLFAFAGVATGGAVSDWLAVRNPRRRLDIQAFGLMVASPFLFILGDTGSLWTVIAALAAFGFFRGIYDSNIYASVYEVVEPRMHATASGFVICFAFLFGSTAPVLLGAIKQRFGLAHGFSVLALAYITGAVCIVAGSARFFERDHKRAQAAAVAARGINNE